MIRHQHCGHRRAILLADGTNNSVTRVGLILAFDLVPVEHLGHRHRAVEIIGVCCPKAWNRLARLCPRRGKSRMRVRDSADVVKSLIQGEMSRKIRRRAQAALDNLALQIGNYQIGRGHRLIGHTARLDDHQGSAAIDPAGIPERIKN